MSGTTVTATSMTTTTLMIQEWIDFPTLDFATTQLTLLDSALRDAPEESGITRSTAQSVKIVFMQGSITAELNLRVRADIRVVRNNKATSRAATVKYLQDLAAADVDSGADLVGSTTVADNPASATT
eukprot:gene32350-30529_t